MIATCDEPTSFAATDPASLAGRFLTFSLGPKTYGIPVGEAREIVRLLPITSVPNMPEYVRGVMNLRGRIIAVMDLRIKFGLREAEMTPTTCIIVVQTSAAGEQRSIGLVVDAVNDVPNIAAENIRSLSSIHEKPIDGRGAGQAGHPDEFISLLRVEHILATEEYTVPESLALGILLAPISPDGQGAEVNQP